MPELLLAFDYGTRRIGVATGDTLTMTARPLTTLVCTGPRPWDAIGRLVNEYSPARLVVGVPYNMDGTPTTLTQPAMDFGHELGERFRLPVEWVDERQSSREAEGQLRQARASGLKRRRVTHGDVDKVAAKVLLERWFHSGGGLPSAAPAMTRE